MQTFLPYPDFADSAKCLDNKRLGKQRVECLQIFNALTKGTGWSNHPAVRMWAGAPRAFVEYWSAVVTEWDRRGFKNSIVPPIMQALALPDVKPEWLGREDFHASHRSNLLRKNPEWYGKFGWTEANDLPYVWPEGK